MSLSKESYPQGRAHLTLYNRRAVLNTAMLLRDSPVAQRVRTYLLDVEERGRSPRDVGSRLTSLETRMTTVEGHLGDVGSAIRDLGPVLSRMSDRLESIDHRLAATNRVVCAMSERLASQGEDIKELMGLKGDVRRLEARMDLAGLPEPRRRRRR